MEKIKATFIKGKKYWVVYTDDIPGAMSQGKTVEEAEKNLIDAIMELRKADTSSVIKEKEIIIQEVFA
ncbi:MAG: type II toxin-antitoxin system HicB family antitoxin [Deltaproteobacteria bacterium]|jgi:predicted RNase H-like HicB family nuclease|nr:type II toxin-antitoxin system HicB family antitoxin [Deltaproteobacteria bacterium]MCL5880076.1 type II toxin-antitoxin system HicB family antitoxin [Deltaproteobacteria bacterium]